MRSGLTAEHPHQGQPVLRRGELLEQAQVAMLMVHGRGASAVYSHFDKKDLERPPGTNLAVLAFNVNGLQVAAERFYPTFWKLPYIF